ncbi:MAG: hypothetical protein ACD_52C00276G0010 [uncultured bacterium]|uniref:Uncharacterized protein n=1 Tax=Candidatus Woesebacteria bacterium RIFCSPHIGHO2_12_FULL_41_24 TaxID=1802510 RepID=A0A1F8AR30_9BACT|nr:MAG: hypothetical protein ACD_52C00276G0010 [uncultured bacterium]OGM13347.1 MAG: hypothetical protein A2W15_05600 [Candidatus Woesebacteria bacterium RBG_16_41_13]OGM30921.1 MAG: hypothetical protein A2873_03915 [Candidatus Woesebacteria bacterium RIFCSPHIGHO2_01_FULL_42_80]OGM35890.1 MAG: hypothetical protein A3D84_01385 [Candidatus Woesebacteria bacterium RIFCSPHIGHO2_02_FULL_42_20]OGM54217.1 MAG: hypothetical protein A3E44_00870 [Candidatus Woesebacteria bacterium RIFCSPHIGHO2_12_FULL_41
MPESAQETKSLEPLIRQEVDSINRTLLLEPLIDKPELFKRGLQKSDFEDFPEIQSLFINKTNQARSAPPDRIAGELKRRDDYFNPYRVNKSGKLVGQARSFLVGQILERDRHFDPLIDIATKIFGDRYDMFTARVRNLAHHLSKRKSSGEPLTKEEVQEAFLIGKVTRYIFNSYLGLQQNDNLDELLENVNFSPIIAFDSKH